MPRIASRSTGTAPAAGVIEPLAFLFKDQDGHINDIFAPDVNENSELGPGGTLRYFAYPSEDTQWFAVAGAQDLCARVGDQRQLTLEHPDEFVLVAVPVALARPCPRFDDRQIYAELAQPRVPRKPLARLRAARLIERTGIGATALGWYFLECDLSHAGDSCR